MYKAKIKFCKNLATTFFNWNYFFKKISYPNRWELYEAKEIYALNRLLRLIDISSVFLVI